MVELSAIALLLICKSQLLPHIIDYKFDRSFAHMRCTIDKSFSEVIAVEIEICIFKIVTKMVRKKRKMAAYASIVFLFYTQDRCVVHSGSLSQFCK